MHQSQFLFYLLLSFLFGAAVASHIPVSTFIIHILLIGGIIGVALSGYRRIFLYGILASLAIMLVAVGMIRFDTVREGEGILLKFAELKAGEKSVPVQMEGYVDGEARPSGASQQFPFRVKKIIVPGHAIDLNERTLITTASYPSYSYGQSLSVIGPVTLPQNFDDFDYKTYLQKEGIRTLVKFPNSLTESELVLSWAEQLKIKIFKLVFNIKSKFEGALNKSVVEPNASYLNGILLGTRQNIPDSLREAFNQTGTSHILAISGYNIAIIAKYILLAFVVFVTRKRAFWMTVGAIILFTIMTGASASVVRAAIMGLLIAFANGYGRLYDPRNALTLAAAAMVWFNPFLLVFDIGFQLSFLAVIGLVYLYPLFESYLKRIPETGKIKETFLMSLSAQVMVLPLIAYYFKSISLISLLVNVLVLPFVPVAMGLGFLTGLAGMIFLPLGKILGWLAWAVSFYQIKVIEFFASFSFSSFTFSVPLWLTVVIYILLTSYLFLKWKRGNLN